MMVKKSLLIAMFISLCILIMAAAEEQVVIDPGPTVATGITLGNTPIVPKLDYVETEIRTISQELSAATGIQILVDQNVEGTVTIGPLEQVPLETALDLICASGGLEWVKAKNYYLILMPDPDNMAFKSHVVTEGVKINNLDARSIPDLLKQYDFYLKVDPLNNQIFITALPGSMMNRIKGAIERVDTAVLKEVEIRLVTLEYSRRDKEEIGLDSLNALLTEDAAKRDIYGIQIGENTFGATNAEIAPLLRLKILASREEIKITGDQKATVREGKIAKINFSKKGDIFLTTGIGGVANNNFYNLEKATVQAEQGVETEILRVTSDNHILINVKGILEYIQETPDAIKTGQAIWTESGKVDTQVNMQNYRTIWIGTLRREVNKQTREITGRGKDNREIEIAFLLTANVVGTKPPAPLEIEAKIEKFFAAKEKGTIHPQFSFGVGGWVQRAEDAWIPSRDSVDPIPIGEIKVKLWENLNIFGGGGAKGKKNLGYFGVQYGDFLTIGAGGIKTNQLSSVKPFLTTGVSLGTDRVRLNIEAVYLPDAPKQSGIKAGINFRFGGFATKQVSQATENAEVEPVAEAPIAKGATQIIEKEKIIEKEILVPLADPEEWNKAIERGKQEQEVK